MKQHLIPKFCHSRFFPFLKNALVGCLPPVANSGDRHAIEDEFLLVACDGLWDAVSSQGLQSIEMPCTERAVHRGRAFRFQSFGVWGVLGCRTRHNDLGRSDVFVHADAATRGQL
eukprot:3045814-Amphidinium_carterae.1